MVVRRQPSSEAAFYTSMAVAALGVVLITATRSLEANPSAMTTAERTRQRLNEGDRRLTKLQPQRTDG